MQVRKRQAALGALVEVPEMGSGVRPVEFRGPGGTQVSLVVLVIVPVMSCPAADPFSVKMMPGSTPCHLQIRQFSWRGTPILCAAPFSCSSNCRCQRCAAKQGRRKPASDSPGSFLVSGSDKSSVRYRKYRRLLKSRTGEQRESKPAYHSDIYQCPVQDAVPAVVPNLCLL